MLVAPETSQRHENSDAQARGDVKPDYQGEFSRSVCAAYEMWDFDDLPTKVVNTVKSFVLDTMGVIGGAAQAQGVDTLISRVSKWERNGPSSTLIGKKRVSPPTAALVNGTAAHAIEFDDFHDVGRVHAYCVILPAVLAAAEEKGEVSGRHFIAALATGAEFHARMGLACYDSLGRGWHPTVALGTMAAAIAVGRILELRGDALLNALGIAFHQASGTRQSMADGALSKRIGPGFAARSGVLAAFLAADGISGPTRCLEGEAGYFRLYEQAQVHPNILMEAIGDKWEVLNFSMKPYPCCRCTHNLIDMGIELHGRGIEADDIERADLYLGRTNWRIVGQHPYQAGKDSIVHAQFNAAYCFARAAVDGCVNLMSFKRPAITQKNVARLAAKSRMLEDPEIEPTATEPARVVVTLSNGEVLRLNRQSMKGSPEQPMTDKEILEKFSNCLATGLDAANDDIAQLANSILNLERVKDVSILAAIFPEASRAS